MRRPLEHALILSSTLALLPACGSSGDPGAGGTGAGSSSSSGGAGGSTSALEAILAELRADPQKAMYHHAASSGWPVPVDGGYLFVNLDTSLDRVAGDHDQWTGTPMTADQGFRWALIDVADGDHYKFTDLSIYTADFFARSYGYDQFGEISLVKPPFAHLDRHFSVGDANMAPRTLRVWVPGGAVTHELYVHDGQNIFGPGGPGGSWKLEESAPAGMLVVGIDNTAARMDEYTHVPDVINGQAAGGKGDQYADFLQKTVRPLIRAHYGEPGPVGLMGSSLGGLISLIVADRYPGDYAFAASLSGTAGWGSIDAGVHNETVIERYAAHGHEKPVLYLDSGGNDGPCADSDGDGIEDDLGAGDNYCENAQLHGVLLSAGYSDQKDVFYWWEPGAQHDEAAWAARVFRPFQIFDAL